MREPMVPLAASSLSFLVWSLGSPRDPLRAPHTTLGTIGVAAIAVLNNQLAGQSAVEQHHQVVDISQWRVHNG